MGRVLVSFLCITINVTHSGSMGLGAIGGRFSVGVREGLEHRSCLSLLPYGRKNRR